MAETFLRVLSLPDPAQIREPRALLTTIAQRLMQEGWRRRDLERSYLQMLMACLARARLRLSTARLAG